MLLKFVKTRRSVGATCCLRYYVCFSLIFLLILGGCRQEDEFAKPRVYAYVDTADIKLHHIRIKQGGEAGTKYLDSLRNIYYTKSLRDRFNVLYMYCDHYFRSGRHDMANNYTDSLVQLLEANDRGDFSAENFISTYYYKADISYLLNDVNTAYEYYYKALSLAKKLDERCFIGYYNLKMGIIVFRNARYKDAIEYFRRSLQNNSYCDERFLYSYRIQQAKNNLGLSYERLGVYDSAVYYYNAALVEVERIKHKYPGVNDMLLGIAAAVIKGNLGGVQARMGNNDTAEALMKESIAVCEKNGNEPIDAQYTRLKLAGLYMTNGRMMEAQTLLSRVASLGDTLKDLSVQTRWNKSMSDYSSLTGNYKDAYNYYMTYVRMQDSLLAQKQTFSMAAIDSYIENIDNRNTIADLKESAEKRKLYLVIVICLSILGIVVTVTAINNWQKSRRHVEELTYMNSFVNKQKTQLEEALYRLEKATGEKDRILKAVSHDMRSPVNSALALLEIFETTVKNPTEEQKEYLHLMRKSGEQALNLTKDLLEVATLSKEKLETELTDITNELRERVKLLQYKAAEKEQRVTFESPGNHISAHVNKEKLLRVVGNLVNNAIKFSPVAGEINVRLKSGVDNFMIEVQDCGIGIPEHLKDKVFDLFSEAKRYGTLGEQPFGLGLSISKQIVEAHGGKIWFDSKEGKGTTFYIIVPYS